MQIATFLLGAALAHADTVYTVSLSGFGFDDGSVSGTIETDGTSGALGSADILSWNLLLNDGIGQTFTINPGNSSAILTGTATTATASLLQFNYDTPPPSDAGDLGYFEILDSANGWGLSFAVPPNQVLGIIGNPFGAGTAGLLELSPQPITLGTAAPEPSCLLLLGSALGVAGICRAARKIRV